MRRFSPYAQTLFLQPTCRRLTRSCLPRLDRPPARLILPNSSTLRRICTVAPIGRPASLSAHPESLNQHPPLPGKLPYPLGRPVQASVSPLLLSLAALSAAAALYAAFQPGSSDELEPDPENDSKDDSRDDFDMADITPETLPGRVGNLTPDQEEKLRELWAAVFKVCAVGEQPADDSASAPAANVAADKSSSKDKPKKRRITLFSRKGGKDKSDSDAASTASGVSSSIKEDDADDKYGQNKQFYDTLANVSPESIRATIWAMVKHDHPDALALRFLRARKWDVEKALVMLVCTMNWRATEMHVDDEIMIKGEEAMLELSKSSDAKEKQLGEDFMAQIRMGKSFLHGVDNKGRPICVVRVRLHHQGEQCEESLERYTVYVIETARMVLRPPVDTATIMFDMTGFSMANMDYTPVKFMIKCFEANYPESLGCVLVHKAPWIFQGIWKIIRSWLDPVVASKIQFTNNLKDLQEHIDSSRVLKELDGEEDWQYKYVEPSPGENAKMKDTATRDTLLAAREQLYQEYEHATIQWIQEPQNTTHKAKRESIAAKLRADYWVLDPYLRARSLYDRTGWIQGEKVDPYPSKTSGAMDTDEHGMLADDVD